MGANLDLNAPVSAGSLALPSIPRVGSPAEPSASSTEADLRPWPEAQIRVYVPGCAGTCAGSLVRKLLIINNVPVCRVNTPKTVASLGVSVTRPGRDRGPPPLEALILRSPAACQKRICARAGRA